MTVKCGVVNCDLRIKANESFAAWKLGRWNNSERVHLNEIGIRFARNADEARCDRDELLEEITACTDAEPEASRLEGEESCMRMCVLANDRRWVFCGDLFNFHASGG